jgi:hypothetical protein
MRHGNLHRHVYKAVAEKDGDVIPNEHAIELKTE